jgi:hypothetical protein
MPLLSEPFFFLDFIRLFLDLLGISVIAIIVFVLNKYRNIIRQKRKRKFESSLTNIGRTVLPLIRRDFEISAEELPITTAPSIEKTGIQLLPEPESVTQRATRLLQRRKIKPRQTLSLHVQDYEIDSDKPSPETQEDIIKWTIVANIQRRSREYFPSEIADSIVKVKTEEYSFELANDGKVSSECIELAEHEDVEPQVYRKVSALNKDEIAKLQRSVFEATKGGGSIHEGREKARRCLEELYGTAVNRRLTEVRDKLKKIPKGMEQKKAKLVERLLKEAETQLKVNPDSASKYMDGVEGILKSTLGDVHRLFQQRAGEFTSRKKRVPSGIDWSEATLGKNLNVGRYSKPELDKIREKFGSLSASEVMNLRYRFGVILAYIYNFPGSTPHEIAEGTVLLPTTVRSEVHFLERLGYVRSLLRKDRLPRCCYPKIDISTVYANLQMFEKKRVLILPPGVSVINFNGKKAYRLTENNLTLTALSPQPIEESVEKKIMEQKFIVGEIRKTTPEEKALVHEDFVIEINDATALSIQEESGFETGKQEILETFF